MKVSHHALTLETLDTLAEADTLCLFIGEDERPLQGVAGFLDWRLCGELSRLLISGFFSGAPGESLLLPTHGRVAAHRVFAMGIGNRAALDVAGLTEVLGRAVDVLGKAKVSAVALEIPAAPQLDEAARTAALEQIFLARFTGDRVLVLQERVQAPPVMAAERRAR